MKTKKFEIKRFSYMADVYDDGITEKEIENMLDESETIRGGIFKARAKWEVKEVVKK